MPPPIVVGLALRDDDDAAPLALAVAMACLTGAPLALACAFVHDPLWPAPPLERFEVLARDALAALEERAAALRDEHEVTVHARPGSPARVLHDLAAELDAGPLVVGSSHRGHIGRVLAGSVTAGVLQGATCAVAVAPRGYDGTHGLQRIAVAYDGSAESREALDAALAFAAFGGGSVHAFTVLQPFAVTSMLAASGANVPVDDEAARRAAADRLAAEALAAVPDGVRATCEVKLGRPASTLAELSGDFGLLVCGSRGYGPVRSVVLGGVSHTLVNSAACPVLILPRPPAHGRHRRHDEHDAAAQV